jgi:glutamate synthase domain-containing protein 3
MKTVKIDARGMHYTPLNQKIRAAVADGAEEIVLDNVLGQRFIGDGLRGNVRIIINGVPGGDLGMFMSGPTCIIHGNAEHAPGNTMDRGMLVIHGSAGDAVAHSMRGGKVFIKNNIGYRGGIPLFCDIINKIGMFAGRTSVRNIITERMNKVRLTAPKIISKILDVR